jgi:phage gp16-like protein
VSLHVSRSFLWPIATSEFYMERNRESNRKLLTSKQLRLNSLIRHKNVVRQITKKVRQIHKSLRLSLAVVRLLFFGLQFGIFFK